MTNQFSDEELRVVHSVMNNSTFPPPLFAIAARIISKCEIALAGEPGGEKDIGPAEAEPDGGRSARGGRRRESAAKAKAKGPDRTAASAPVPTPLVPLKED